MKKIFLNKYICLFCVLCLLFLMCSCDGSDDINNDDNENFSGIFRAKEKIENNTKTYQVVMPNKISTLLIKYKVHSQSQTNYRKNSVKITIFDNEGVELGNQIDKYSSESVWGTPIPGNWHSIEFPMLSLNQNDIIDIEITVSEGDYKNYISVLEIYNNSSHLSKLNMSRNQILKGMKNNYFYWSNDIPLGDYNRNNIGNVTKDQRLVFSESASYALFLTVLQVYGEDEDYISSKFSNYWKWIKQNLIRKNINSVYSWNYDINPDQYQQWIDMPTHLRDSLMSWRWVRHIQNTDESGIIYQITDEETDPNTPMIFQDGTQVASDADLLVAYSLYLAYQRGWGNEYIEEAKKIIYDLRKKCVIDFTAGEILNAEKNNNPSNIYYGTYIDSYTNINGFIDKIKSTDSIAWLGKNNYLGLNNLSLLDLSNLEQIEVKMKGATKGNPIVDFRIVDQTSKGKEGHIYYSKPIVLTSNYKTHIFYKSDFSKFPLHGEQNGKLDWSKIKNFTFQTSSNSEADLAEIHLRSLKIKLKAGQTSINNGFHFIMNDSGMPCMNVSYLMPFVFKVFKKIDQDGAHIWQKIIDNSYTDIKNALKIQLHDTNNELVKSNGHLLPNFFQFNIVSGQIDDIFFQKKHNTIRGYIHGYDSFRLIAYLSIDYYMNKDSRSMEILKQIYPFFKDELLQNNFIYPEYKINGEPVKDDYKSTSMGFYAVYWNMFNILSDQECMNKIKQLYTINCRSKNNRVWMTSNEKILNYGETEYFMNMWSFFGSYFVNEYLNQENFIENQTDIKPNRPNIFKEYKGSRSKSSIFKKMYDPETTNFSQFTITQNNKKQKKLSMKFSYKNTKIQGSYMQSENSSRLSLNCIHQLDNKIEKLQGQIYNKPISPVKILTFVFINGWEQVPCEMIKINNDQFNCDMTTFSDKYISKIAIFLVPYPYDTNILLKIKNDEDISEYFFKKSLTNILLTRNRDICFQNIPNYGNRIKNLSGFTSVDPEKYYVFVYIHANNSWCIKPEVNQPRVKISNNGHWECDITRNQYDPFADKIIVFLLSKEYQLEEYINNCIPGELFNVSRSYIEVTR